MCKAKVMCRMPSDQSVLFDAGQRQLQEQQQRLVSMMSPAATAPPPRQGLTAAGSIVAPPTRP